MKTIDDRAQAWAENHRECYALDAPYIMEMSYHQGATEQKAIDIDKACESYCKVCDTKECIDEYTCNWVEKFRKAMEE